MSHSPSGSGPSPAPDGNQEAAPIPVPERGIGLPERDLDRLLSWFVRIRWVFVAGLAATILAGVRIFPATFPLRQTLAIAGAILVYNALFLLWQRHRRVGTGWGARASRIEAGLQIGLDLLALTALVHFSGGAGSPFTILYVIHAIGGSMLLPRRLAWLVGAAAFSLLVAVVVLESEPIGSYPRTQSVHALSPLQHRSLRVALALAFLVAMATATSITSSIMSDLRLRERQLLGAQEALLRKSEDLELAGIRLRENHVQLVQAEKQAALGRLVAGIAHEINNPIQFIRGNMTVLTEAFRDLLPVLDEHFAGKPSLQVARLDYPFFRRQLPVLLQDMADGAARIGCIVSDLKTFAHRDEGKLDEPVDLTETVRSSVRLLHNDLKHFGVEETFDPGLPRIRGNPTQLQQVVLNVLQNACQALGNDPGGRIGIRTRLEPGGAWGRLSIEDNGCGIPPHLMRRIFDPFFTTKTRSEGTGLGLAITDEIVQRHQGRIEVESRAGVGTTFHVLLPVGVGT